MPYCKNFPDFCKNFPDSNATTLPWFFWLCPPPLCFELIVTVFLMWYWELRAKTRGVNLWENNEKMSNWPKKWDNLAFKRYVWEPIWPSKDLYGSLCILGSKEHFWCSQNFSLFVQYSDTYIWEWGTDNPPSRKIKLPNSPRVFLRGSLCCLEGPQMKKHRKNCETALIKVWIVENVWIV